MKLNTWNCQFKEFKKKIPWCLLLHDQFPLPKDSRLSLQREYSLIISPCYEKQPSAKRKERLKLEVLWALLVSSSFCFCLFSTLRAGGGRTQRDTEGSVCLCKRNLNCGRGNFLKHFSPKIDRGRKQWNGWCKTGSKVAEYFLFALFETKGLGSISSWWWEQGHCWETRCV